MSGDNNGCGELKNAALNTDSRKKRNGLCVPNEGQDFEPRGRRSIVSEEFSPVRWHGSS